MAQKVYGVYGLGLIGASVALAIKSSIADAKVIGFGRNKESLEKAKRLGIIDQVAEPDDEIVEEIEVLVIGTPAEMVAETFSKFHNHLSDDVIVMDVASVKRIVIDSVAKVNRRNLNFVGAHPMAGSEKSGMDFARADLFEKKIVAVIGDGREDVLERVRDFWKTFGSQIVIVSADFHDEIVGSTSHATHLIACALSRQLEKDGWSEVRFFGLYGKGLLDTTRIAQGPPEMWADIIFMNADNVERSLVDFSREIGELVKVIQSDDRKLLIDYLQKSKEFRENL